MVKGIGPHLAKVLVKAYGMEVFTVIEEHPEQLLGLPQLKSAFFSPVRFHLQVAIAKVAGRQLWMLMAIPMHNSSTET